MEIIKKIFEVIDPHDKKMLIVIFFIIITTNIIEILNIGSIIAVANLLINEESFLNLINNFPIFKHFFSNMDIDSVFKIFLVFSLIFVVLKSLVLLIFFWIKNKFLFNFEVKLRDKLLNKYLNQDYSFFLKKNISHFLRNINTESGNFRYVALQAPLQLSIDMLMVIFITLSLLAIRPYETIFLIVIFFLILIIYYILLKPYLTKWGEKKLETENKIVKNLTETFGLIKEILIYKLKSKFVSKNLIDNSRLANINVINYFTSELPRHFLEILGIGILLIYLFFLLELGSIDTTNLVLSLTIYSMALYKLLPSFVRISNSVKDIKFGIPVINTIYNDLKLKDSILEESSKPKLVFKESIKLENIELPYKEDKANVVKKINIKFNKNESVAIIGKSGTGKSTILNLISGLIKPTAGKILCDGKDIHENLNDWHLKISILDQNIFLLDDTIKNNILLANINADYDEKKIRESINMASANDLVDKKENKLESLVGEKNKYISGGEAQRIAIARIFYRNAEILLLDEFSLNLDQKNMNNIIENLMKFKKHKTIIATTHEQEILQYFDKIIDLDNI